MHNKTTAGLDKISHALNSNVMAAPEHASALLDFLKENEVGELLQQSRERLQSLVKGDISSKTESVLGEHGIEIDVITNKVGNISGDVRSKREEAIKALANLRLKSKEMSEKTLKETDVIDMVESWDALVANLSTVSVHDDSLGDIVSRLSEKGKLAKASGARMFDQAQKTRSVMTLFDGVEKLKKRAESIMKENNEVNQLNLRRLSDAPIMQQLKSKQYGTDKTLAGKISPTAF